MLKMKEIFVILLSTLVILFGYPFIFVFIFLCWIHKKIVIKLANKDPKIRKTLEGIDAVFAAQDPYSDPFIVPIIYFSLASKLDIPTVVKVLQEKVIEPKVYPELTQRIVRKYGYHFWYSVDNFKVENHVHYLKPECPNMPITRTELTDILNNEVGKLPFDSNLSPWEILIVPNLVDERDPEVKSAFIWKFNHCLMDGYSIMNFWKKIAIKPWKVLGGHKLESKQNKTNSLAEIYKFLNVLISGPYHLLNMFVFSNDTHTFVKNTYKPDFEEIFNSQYTPPISDLRLKTIRNAYGVTLSSLITTLFGEATWKCMKRAGVPVPNTIHGMLAYPLEGHQDNLYNHWSLVRIPINIDETDPRETLKFVEKEFQILRKSVKPLAFLYANKMISLIPLWLRINPKSTASMTPSTFLMTNFPGPTEPSDMFGCTVKQFSLAAKPSHGPAFYNASLSVAGNFWLETTGPVCNLPNQRAADLLNESVMDTLACLERGMPGNKNKEE